MRQYSLLPPPLIQCHSTGSLLYLPPCIQRPLCSVGSFFVHAYNVFPYNFVLKTIKAIKFPLPLLTASFIAKLFYYLINIILFGLTPGATEKLNFFTPFLPKQVTSPVPTKPFASPTYTSPFCSSTLIP